MSDAIIEKIQSSTQPYQEPQRHFRFGDEGITRDCRAPAAISSYFVPIARPQELRPDALTARDRVDRQRMEENEFINQRPRARGAVAAGRLRRHYADDARACWTTGRRRDRERRLFFCQIEALETLIYLTEVARKFGDAWIEN